MYKETYICVNVRLITKYVKIHKIIIVYAGFSALIDVKPNMMNPYVYVEQTMKDSE